ncbi:MAG TPA: sugar phosphate isomerase/epimerase [Ruminococcaceae bacterium]|nr:sugar phosphate isomerase/epimerase [Oscillospiraceae bacterium]
MKKPTMGIQLYTLRDHIKTAEDFDKTLARLKAMGVTDVQISAIGDIPAQTQKEILDKYGMKVCLTHKPFDRMADDLDNLIAEHKVIDCDAIGLGSANDTFRGNRGNVRRFIRESGEIGKKMKAQGCSFHYHNHAFEFYRLDDMNRCMMDLLLAETDPEVFYFIPDVAWIHYGGADPAEMLRKMKGRIKVIHFKDYIFDEEGVRHFVPLGQGIVNLKACYKVACELEIPYIMYEHDSDWPDDDPFKACEESWKFMCKLTNE